MDTPEEIKLCSDSIEKLLEHTKKLSQMLNEFCRKNKELEDENRRLKTSRAAAQKETAEMRQELGQWRLLEDENAELRQKLEQWQLLGATATANILEVLSPS
jgi:hypothetical protein